ncbi:DUF6516 family protein [Parageobacillus thermoglucosidasius]|uniref:toxin-antitoxin system TumE family protein n=1 Tax=Parageobacillus thermoglucosidasius TaxID=1426 RepID=UPI00055725A4|nr:DUF6516 family protein [Parageobacillus thermoglucosidasius]REK57160.1 MAG: hypothetical protein C6P36_08450 [Geobacillus sp.]GMO00773.1 hypothetical protein PthstB1num2_28130 [Parageobacillus thermoglucosidasius]
MNKQQYQQKRIQYIQELFELNPDLFDHSLVPDIRPKGSNRVVATLPLNHHEIYGETVLFINEKLDDNGNIERYNYGWEYSQRERRMGRSVRHITAFGKEEHKNSPHCVATDPYHHHHVPGDVAKRKETSVRDLETVVAIIREYIVNNKEYNENHSF